MLRSAGLSTTAMTDDTMKERSTVAQPHVVADMAEASAPGPPASGREHGETMASQRPRGFAAPARLSLAPAPPAFVCRP
jgi:hypothetical protein